MVDGDFRISENEKPMGQCIWHGCDAASKVVIECIQQPFSMDVCLQHAEKMLKTKVVPGPIDKMVGLSVGGTTENPDDEEIPPKKN